VGKWHKWLPNASEASPHARVRLTHDGTVDGALVERLHRPVVADDAVVVAVVVSLDREELLHLRARHAERLVGEHPAYALGARWRGERACIGEVAPRHELRRERVEVQAAERPMLIHSGQPRLPELLKESRWLGAQLEEQPEDEEMAGVIRVHHVHLERVLLAWVGGGHGGPLQHALRASTSARSRVPRCFCCTATSKHMAHSCARTCTPLTRCSLGEWKWNCLSLNVVPLKFIVPFPCVEIFTVWPLFYSEH